MRGWEAGVDRRPPFFLQVIRYERKVGNAVMQRVFVVLLFLSLILAAATGNSLPVAARGLVEKPVSLTTVPNWDYGSDQEGALLGSSTAAAGDVNGDGFADVIIGAPKYQVGDVYKDGAALVFHGPLNSTVTIPSWKMGSSVQGSEYGKAVASAGDVNGDNYDDVIVGAPEYKNSVYKVGAAYVHFGSKDGLGFSDGDSYLLESYTKESKFGYSVSSGYFNGDEFADVMVGAPYYDILDDDGKVVTDNVGAIFIFYGGPGDFCFSSNWSYIGEQSYALLGYSVSAAGDINKDGYDDVIAGAPYYNGEVTSGGAFYVFYGSENGIDGDTSLPYEIYTGTQVGSRYGFSVSGAGDINKDSYADVIVGAPYLGEELMADGTLLRDGAVFIFQGGPTGLGSLPEKILRSGKNDAWYGSSISSAGDVNNDSFDDIVIGAHNFTGDQPKEGRVYLYLGSPTGVIDWVSDPNNDGWYGEGNKAEAFLGSSASGAGDVNADGFDDLIAGAPEYMIQTVKRGIAFVYFGTEDVNIKYYTYLPGIFAGR